MCFQYIISQEHIEVHVHKSPVINMYSFGGSTLSWIAS